MKLLHRSSDMSATDATVAMTVSSVTDQNYITSAETMSTVARKCHLFPLL
jgi:hypothetical protein